MIVKNNKGFGVVEVVVSLTIASIIIVSVGSILSSVNRMNTTSENKEKAIAFAKDSLETITAVQNDLFACICSQASCITNSCTRPSDNQSCSLFSGFFSCWTRYPKNLSVNNPLHIASAGGSFVLIEGVETIVSDLVFTREVKIENLFRDAYGNIVETGGTEDINTKKITVTIKWSERSIPSEVSLNTILTAWKNIE